MSEDEHTLCDYPGQFAQVVVDGRKVPDLEWVDGRILLSTRRLVLASGDGKRTIPLTAIDGLKSHTGSGALTGAEAYVSVQTGSDVTLVAPTEHGVFERKLHAAILNDRPILVKHPAVEGGVVQDRGWEKARLNLGDGIVYLAISTGQFVEIEVEDVGRAVETERTVADETRPVLEVEHTDDGTAVETHLSGPSRELGLLSGLFHANERDSADVDLTDEQTEVVVALYSGVSPFRIPDFVGMDVDRVESIYDDLAEAGILEKRRTRREVKLQARGRHIAGEASGEE